MRFRFLAPDHHSQSTPAIQLGKGDANFSTRKRGVLENLLAKYGVLTPLRHEEEAAFRSFAVTKRGYAAGATIVAGEYDDPDYLYVVEEGRLFASSDLPSGDRAITRLYFAGDIVGTANIPFERATQTITVQSAAVVYAFPRDNLIEVFTRLPRVAAIFYTFAALENAILNDRLVSVGRMRGKARLASLILEIAARRNLTRSEPASAFPLGLTQSQIGDAIGLTEVQVNRLFRTLCDDGSIAHGGGNVEILNWDRLCEIGHFHDRYDDLDLDWFDHKL